MPENPQLKNDDSSCPKPPCMLGVQVQSKGVITLEITVTYCFDGDNQIMLPYGWKFRHMKSSDLDDVLIIINDHDEDDFESAKESYEELGISDQFVLKRDNVIVGVTGFRYAEGTDNTYWLSWTYLQSDEQAQRMGTRMLEELFEILKKKNARKIFVSTSDYIDPEKGSIYRNAIRLYKTMGFNEEIIHPDYFNPGESELIFGFHIQPKYPPRRIKPDKRGIALDVLYEIDETVDIYAIDWEFYGKKCFSENELRKVLGEAKTRGARSVFMAFPSNVHSVYHSLEASGFQPIGMLEDFYSDGLNKIHFRYDI